MKQFALITCMLVLLSSCQNWLEVEPKSEIKSDLMFESASGFRDALNGVYILMRGSDLYGQEATWGFVDAIGQQFDVYNSSAARYYQAIRYNYNQTVNMSNGIWNKAYKTIANINNMLENINEKQTIMEPTVYGIYKGEALGLRAFLHFDLLRIFGWGNLEKTPANGDKLCIPYVTSYSKELQKQLTVNELFPLLERDLKASIELLDASDPYGLAPKYDDYYLPNDDRYFDARPTHFNYWAAVATLARVYMWYGKKAEALELVQSFIERAPFSWVSSYSVDAYKEEDRDITFTPEHVFVLNANIFEDLRPFIDPTDNDPNANDNLIFHKQSRADNTFEVTNGGSTDYRYRRQYNKVNQYFDGWALTKYWEVENYAFGDRIALIKKPELYYMAAECLLATGKEKDKQKAIDMLNTVRYYRGISQDYDLPYSLEANQVQNEITKEYQKEFMCEGQLFYYYKRLGFEKIPYSTKPGSDATYVVPLPNNDVELGGMEDYKPKY